VRLPAREREWSRRPVDQELVLRRTDRGDAVVVTLEVQPARRMIPSSASSGRRDARAPVVPGWERMSVRVTSRSNVAGAP
jgi:hypothetical protein